MATEKVFVCGGVGNTTTNLVVQRVSDGFYLQSSDGSFGASFSAIAMTPEMDDGGSYSGYHEWVEDREVWQDGTYRVAMGQPSGTGIYDASVAYRVRSIGDVLMEGAALSATTARNATAATVNSLKTLGEGQVDISKRLGVLESRVDSFNVSLTRR